MGRGWSDGASAPLGALYAAGEVYEDSFGETLWSGAALLMVVYWGVVALTPTPLILVSACLLEDAINAAQIQR